MSKDIKIINDECTASWYLGILREKKILRGTIMNHGIIDTLVV